MSLKLSFAGWLALLLLLAAPASAQIGPLQTPDLSDLPSVPRHLPGIEDVDTLARRSADRALQAPSRLTSLVRRSRGALEADPDGWPVVAAEIVVVDLSDAARAEALHAGFTVVREERLESLDLNMVVLAPPRRLSLSRAVARLRALDPAADVSFNHIYSPAGETSALAGAPPAPAAASGEPQAPDARLGLIDTGVEATHPAWSGRGSASAALPGRRASALTAQRSPR